jgi:hypothetical protein
MFSGIIVTGIVTVFRRSRDVVTRHTRHQNRAPRVIPIVHVWLDVNARAVAGPP